MAVFNDHNYTDGMVSPELLRPYKEKMRRVKEEQEAVMAKRIQDNLEHEKSIASKIIEEIKRIEETQNNNDDDLTTFSVRAEPNYMVAVLFRSTVKIPPKQKKCLQLLRLSKINQVVVIKNNKCNKNLCRTASAYLAYGFIDYSLLRRLIYSKACCFFRYPDGTKTKIKLSNEAIEDHFEGKYRCIEEILFEVYMGGDDTRDILRFLAPVNLQAPRGGYIGKKKLKVSEGGVSGHHGDSLGKYLSKMIQ